jgi:hypothetical protein
MYRLGGIRRSSTRFLGAATVLSTAVLSTAVMTTAVLTTVAGASGPSATSFTASGAISGKFHSPNEPCDEVGAFGGQFTFSQKVKGSNATEWTVDVNDLGKKKGGTFKKFGGLFGNGVSVVLQGSNGKVEYNWVSKSGALTTADTSGHLKVTLGPDETFTGKPGKGTVHLSGSWGCDSN